MVLRLITVERAPSREALRGDEEDEEAEQDDGQAVLSDPPAHDDPPLPFDRQP